MTSHVQDAQPAADGEEYHSTAYNFYSHIRGQVDPRTGMYSASVDLTTGEGNRLRGPSFDFQLAYSALRASDEGFGEGWHLRMTELDRSTRHLSLSTGEAYTTRALQPAVEATYVDRKLNTFILTPGNGLLSATVEHITGAIEYLGLPGGRGEILKPMRIEKDPGEGINIEWVERPTGGIGLHRIVDDEGAELLRIDYRDFQVTELTLRVGNGGPVVLRFHRTARLLRTVELETLREFNAIPVRDDEVASWAFDYALAQASPRLMLLTRVTHPTGIRETVRYAEQMMELPRGGPRMYMPVVIQRVQRREINLDEVIEASEYQYTRANFYGFPIVSSWQSATDQLLYLRGQGSFRYGSTEKRLDVDLSTELLRIEREYDQFHLQTREKTTRGGLVNEVVTRYGGMPGLSFDEQPAAFQMPHRVTTTLFEERASDIRQETYEETTYDDVGNIIEHYVSATDIEERSDYYPVEGATEPDGTVLCPPDPLGLLRRLRSRSVAPRTARFPSRTTTFRYTSLPARPTRGMRDMAPARMSGWDWLRRICGAITQGRRRSRGRTPRARGAFVQPSQEKAVADDGSGPRELERTDTAFLDDLGPWHGSVATEVHHRDGLERRTAYGYAEADETVTKTVRETTHDGLEVVHSETMQRLTGLLRASEDHLGNKASYSYDGMARRQLEEHAPDSPEYHAQTRWAYQVSAAERWIMRRGVTGLEHRVWLDERGKGIRFEEPMSVAESMLVLEATYDALGQKVSEAALDRVDGGRAIRVVTDYAYDGWGEPSLVSTADGSRRIIERSLLHEPTISSQPLLRAVEWREGGGMRTDWTATDADAAGRKRRVQTGGWLDGQRGPAVTTQRWDYDGLGRCVRTTDVMGRMTSQTWDADDRVVIMTLPDQSVIQWDYVSGSDADDIGGVTLTPVAGQPMSLGEREFDGLRRLVRDTAGTLQTTCTYVGVAGVPGSKRLPSGAALTIRHDPRLHEAVTSVELEDGGVPVLMAGADYDKRTGLPETFRSDGYRLDVEPDVLGRLAGQSITAGQAEPRHLKVEPSPVGRPLNKLHPDGSRQRFLYDDLGRVVIISDADTTTTFTYDGLSRLASRHVATIAGERLSDERTYDGMGRLSTQWWRFEGAASRWERRQELERREDGKVILRRWLDGGARRLREETMDYDERGRLTRHGIVYAADGEHPRDPQGHPFTLQVFEYDAIDNLVKVETFFRDGLPNVTTYRYHDVDRDRLVAFRHTRPDYPGGGAEVVLRYDAGGNVIDDGMGHTLGWDGAGRLAWIRTRSGVETRYAHGPDGRVSEVHSVDGDRFRYYDDGSLAWELVDAANGRRFIRTPGGPVGETILSQSVRTTFLLGVDGQGSVVVRDDSGARGQTYDTFGAHQRLPGDLRSAYAGEVVEDEVDLYVLGQRVYSPALRRFLNPDIASPMGRGGLNRYAYCLGDPINRIDPSGAMSVSFWISIGILVASLVATVVTLGAAAATVVGAAAAATGGAVAGGAASTALFTPATALMLSTGAFAVSTALDIGSAVAASKGDDDVSTALGWISVGFSFLGAAPAGALKTVLMVAAEEAVGDAVDDGFDNAPPVDVSIGPALGDQGTPALVDANHAREQSVSDTGASTSGAAGSGAGRESLAPRTFDAALGSSSSPTGGARAAALWEGAGLGSGDVYLYTGVQGGRAAREQEGRSTGSQGARHLHDSARRQGASWQREGGRLPLRRGMIGGPAERAARTGLPAHAYCYGAVDEWLLAMFNRSPIAGESL